MATKNVDCQICDANVEVDLDFEGDAFCPKCVKEKADLYRRTLDAHWRGEATKLEIEAPPPAKRPYAKWDNLPAKVQKAIAPLLRKDKHEAMALFYGPPSTSKTCSAWGVFYAFNYYNELASHRPRFMKWNALCSLAGGLDAFGEQGERNKAEWRKLPTGWPLSAPRWLARWIRPP